MPCSKAVTLSQYYSCYHYLCIGISIILLTHELETILHWARILFAMHILSGLYFCRDASKVSLSTKWTLANSVAYSDWDHLYKCQKSWDSSPAHLHHTENTWNSLRTFSPLPGHWHLFHWSCGILLGARF